MVTDSLTGLPTKRAFVSSLQGRKTGGLIYVDIVRLAFSNAVLGPTATDQLLKDTGDLLRRHAPVGPIARVSGGEFVVFTKDSEEAAPLAEVLTKAFKSQFAEHRARIRAGTAEAGVIEAPADVLTLSTRTADLESHDSPEDAIRAAQSAMS